MLVLLQRHHHRQRRRRPSRRTATTTTTTIMSVLLLAMLIMSSCCSISMLLPGASAHPSSPPIGNSTLQATSTTTTTSSRSSSTSAPLSSSSSTSTSSGNNNNTLSSSCPYPLLHISFGSASLPADDASRRLCDPHSGCCVSCPPLYAYYDNGSVERYLRVTDTLRVCSFFGALVVFVSFLVLPGKRRHPSAIIMWFSLSAALFGASVFFTAGGTNRSAVQCTDAITPASQSSNTLCAIQGSFLIFTSFAMAYWCSFLIINLHLVTVWNRNVFADRYAYVHPLCWGVPALFAAIGFAVRAVRFEFGSLCLVSLEWSNYLFFLPIGVMAVSSFIIHMFTMGFIVKTAVSKWRAGWLEESASGAGAEKVQPSSASVSETRLRVMTIWNSSWRSIFVAVTFMSTFILFWIFYGLGMGPTRDLNASNPSVIAWFSCILSIPVSWADAASSSSSSFADAAARAQTCTNQHIRSLLPNFFFMMVAGDLLPSIGGLGCFLSFALRPSMYTDWMDHLFPERRARRAAAIEEPLHLVPITNLTLSISPPPAAAAAATTTPTSPQISSAAAAGAGALSPKDIARSMDHAFMSPGVAAAVRRGSVRVDPGVGASAATRSGSVRVDATAGARTMSSSTVNSRGGWTVEEIRTND